MVGFIYRTRQEVVGYEYLINIDRYTKKKLAWHQGGKPGTPRRLAFHQSGEVVGQVVGELLAQGKERMAYLQRVVGRMTVVDSSILLAGLHHRTRPHQVMMVWHYRHQQQAADGERQDMDMQRLLHFVAKISIIVCNSVAKSYFFRLSTIFCFFKVSFRRYFHRFSRVRKNENGR
jgi:hypothetical protein